MADGLKFYKGSEHPSPGNTKTQPDQPKSSGDGPISFFEGSQSTERIYDTRHSEGDKPDMSGTGLTMSDGQ